jgi:hypothetical protein
MRVGVHRLGEETNSRPYIDDTCEVALGARHSREGRKKKQ